ncbi:ArsR/SmtB family transcription factor [Kutzneria buriramensis]|uniref:ArsR/SmtB family transcription factor n=1 Tax=Kutzneria buriramensis TaxID=1045776 RepID=UPI0024826388|nr:metalloregulator ArsR/SmtB family transcription factor [Kutzneria buriramensis]
MIESKVLAAMAHPLRRRLLDVLKVEGPATVSALAERTGQAVGNISHHMKVLAAAGLVDEAPELAGDRRERWWRIRAGSLSWSARDYTDDPAATAVAEAAESLNLDHHLSLVRAWQAGRESYPAAWQDAAFSTDAWLRLSPAELDEFREELIGLIVRWARREIPDDGQERDAVFTFAYGIPAKP